MFQEEAAELRPGLIEAHTLVAFQKQFTNLGIQESRLLRRFEKTRAELVAIQTSRHAAKSQPAVPKPKSATDKLSAESCGLNAADPVGSEFSTPPQSASKRSGAEDQPLTPEHKAIVEAAVARFAAKANS